MYVRLRGAVAVNGRTGDYFGHLCQGNVLVNFICHAGERLPGDIFSRLVSHPFGTTSESDYQLPFVQMGTVAVSFRGPESVSYK